MTENNQPISNFLLRLSEKARKPETDAREGAKNASDTLSSVFNKVGKTVSSGYENVKDHVQSIREELSERARVEREVNEGLKAEEDRKNDTTREDRLDNIFESIPAQEVTDATIESLITSESEEIGKTPIVQSELDAAYYTAIREVAARQQELESNLTEISKSFDNAKYNVSTVEPTEEESNSIVDMITEVAVEEVTEVVEPVEETVKQSELVELFTGSTGVTNVIALGNKANDGKAFSVSELNDFAKDIGAKFVKVAIDSTTNKDNVTKTQLGLDAIEKFSGKSNNAKTVFLVNAKNSTAGLIKVMRAITELPEDAQESVAGVIIQTDKRPLSASVKEFVRVIS